MKIGNWMVFPELRYVNSKPDELQEAERYHPLRGT